MTPVKPACDAAVIQTSPRTLGFASGCSVNVVPLWNASAATLPSGPRVTLSDGAAFTLLEVCTMLALASPVLPQCTPNRNVGSRSFQIFGESKPSLLRSEMSWSPTAIKPPPSRTKFKMAVFSAALNNVFGSGTMKTSKFDRSSGFAPLP